MGQGKEKGREELTSLQCANESLSKTGERVSGDIHSHPIPPIFIFIQLYGDIDISYGTCTCCCCCEDDDDEEEEKLAEESQRVEYRAASSSCVVEERAGAER